MRESSARRLIDRAPREEVAAALTAMVLLARAVVGT